MIERETNGQSECRMSGGVRDGVKTCREKESIFEKTRCRMVMMRITTSVKNRMMGHHREKKCEKRRRHREGEATNTTAGGSPL